LSNVYAGGLSPVLFSSGLAPLSPSFTGFFCPEAINNETSTLLVKNAVNSKKTLGFLEKTVCILKKMPYSGGKTRCFFRGGTGSKDI
jgi:hypothetical protein